MTDLNVNPTDNGADVPGARRTLGIYAADGRPCPMEPAIRDQANFFHSDAPFAPHDAAGKPYPTPFFVYGAVDAEGYKPATFGPIQWDGASDLPIGVPLTAVPSFNWPLERLARVRGAMWTVRGPWRFGPRPGQPDNITALDYFYSYGDPMRPDQLSAEQEEILTTYTGLGFTHCVAGPINAQSYHGQYPDTDFTSPEMFEKWLDWLEVFWKWKLALVCFLHGDGQTFDETVAMYDHLIRGNARAQRLMRIVVPTGWEPTRYGWSSVTWAKYCAWARDLLPNALVLIHTVAEVDAPAGTDELFDDNDPVQNPTGNGGAWSRVAPHIHGWLIQNGESQSMSYTTGPAANPQLAKNFAAQFMADGEGAAQHSVAWHFATGANGWPTGSAWGPSTRVKLYNGECTSYAAYWNNLPYADSAAWGDLAIASGADGYLDSGSVDVPWRGL